MHLTHGSHGPVADELPGTKGKVLKGQILQLPLARLKATVSEEHNGSIIPVKSVTFERHNTLVSTARRAFSHFYFRFHFYESFEQLLALLFRHNECLDSDLEPSLQYRRPTTTTVINNHIFATVLIIYILYF